MSFSAFVSLWGYVAGVVLLPPLLFAFWKLAYLIFFEIMAETAASIRKKHSTQESDGDSDDPEKNQPLDDNGDPKMSIGFVNHAPEKTNFNKERKK